MTENNSSETTTNTSVTQTFNHLSPVGIATHALVYSTLFMPVALGYNIGDLIPKNRFVTPTSTLLVTAAVAASSWYYLDYKFGSKKEIEYNFGEPIKITSTKQEK